MLRLENVVLAAGDFVLRANFAVADRQQVAIIGASGSGKSTLLDGLAGFNLPQEGRILWQGLDITQHPPAQRPVSLLFQDTNLFPHLTIERNLALALNPRTGRLRSGDRDQVAQALARVGLDGFSQRYLRDMSGGQQSRAALARVLLEARPILLLDEPFAALGPALRNEMLDLVEQTTGEAGTTVLLVTHTPDEARRFAPQTIVVENAVAHAPTATGPLLDDPPPGLMAYLGN